MECESTLPTAVVNLCSRHCRDNRPTALVCRSSSCSSSVLLPGSRQSRNQVLLPVCVWRASAFDVERMYAVESFVFFIERVPCRGSIHLGDPCGRTVWRCLDYLQRSSFAPLWCFPFRSVLFSLRCVLIPYACLFESDQD